MEAGRYHEGDLQIQFMHFGLADVAYLVFTADGHEFQCGLQHPGLVEDIYCTDTSFVSYLGVTTGVFSMKMGGTDSCFCMKGQRALCQDPVSTVIAIQTVMIIFFFFMSKFFRFRL